MSETPEPNAVAVREEAANLLEIIARAAIDERCDIAKMERLLALQERLIAEQRRTAFMLAMARVAAKAPEIGQHGTSHQGPYARLVDIDRVMRPILSGEGLSLSFDSIPMDGKVRVICKLSHADGHSESKQIDLPLDTSGSKNGAQAVISTVSYGRRALTKMFFNLVESDGQEDDDGNGGSLPITDEQVKDLETLIEDVRADVKRFKVYMGVSQLRDILQRDFKKATVALESKRAK